MNNHRSEMDICRAVYNKKEMKVEKGVENGEKNSYDKSAKIENRKNKLKNKEIYIFKIKKCRKIYKCSRRIYKDF